jgi:hypothetical protein
LASKLQNLSQTPIQSDPNDKYPKPSSIKEHFLIHLGDNWKMESEGNNPASKSRVLASKRSILDSIQPKSASKSKKHLPQPGLKPAHRQDPHKIKG